jgi:hypothetical protein
MNITELDSYNLADAVKFNNTLNPVVWSGQKMKPEVRERLLTIAQDFKEFLGLSDIEVKDITVSGSNAGYTYTPYSDIDLHLVVDIPQADESDVYRELFDAKKYQYNDQHNITIGGYDVELYVEDARKQPVSQGIYSMIDNDWVKIPLKQRATVNDEAVKSKYEDIGHRIESAVASGDGAVIAELANKIRNMRQAGLDAHGELGAENLAFKMLRNQGMIKKLYDARMAAQDRELSLNERRKKKAKKKKTKYGFGGYWYPGFGFAGSGEAPADGGGDGGGGESIQEAAPTTEDTVTDFVNFCVEKLGIENTPRIRFKRDPVWSKRNRTFGSYNHDTNELIVSLANRHVMDILRTVAHELTHQRQGEVADIPADAGATGSEYENEANAQAGVLMRKYGQLHPELFDTEHTMEATYSLGSSKMFQRGDGVIDNYGLKLLPYGGTVIQQVGHMVSITDADTGETVRLPANMLVPFKPRRKPTQEGVKEKLGAIAAAACIAGTPGCATTTAGAVRDAQTAARTAQTVKNMTKQGVKAELDQELQNFLRAQGQGPGSANAKNQSRLYQLQKQMQNKDDVKESSGYIPTRKQAKLPQFSNALSVDVQPGAVGKEANKLSLNTDSQGHPELLIKGLKNALREFKETGRVSTKLDALGNQRPTGPEFKPTMPAGTLRVDVSDVYDWYKLGQHIPNMKGLGQHDFGQGPPDAIISFGDEDTEHKFIGDLKATGLDVTDIDPADPVKRSGPKIKTDSTYNVNEFVNSPGRDNDDVPDQLLILANRWWNATDQQPQIESVLNSMGWSIRQVESEDDAVQLQHQDGTTYFISADDFDPDLFESVQLDEVKMSPSALSKFADSEAAQGIRAGFEAELIFRDTRGDDDDDQDMEPDMDADERARSIEQVVEFFSNDDWGYGMSERSANRLRDQLDEAYFEWRDEQMVSEFEQEAEDRVREVWLEERPMNERILSALSDGMGLDDAEADKILVIGDKAPRFTKHSEQTAYKEANPGYDKYLEAVDIADSVLDEEVEASVSNQDGYYDQALEEFRDNYDMSDDSGFFDDIGMRWMSDVMSEYGLDWPYMSGGGSSNYGSRDWDDIGVSLRNATGMAVKVSSNYHSQKRGDYYVVEPDGSLSPDDRSQEAGLEIVSPPMPLNQAIEQLQRVIEWANDPNEGNAYTNSSTGLHMGISIPYKGGDVDYLKLILFMGDQYVLEKFGRAANTYTASAMGKLKQNVAGSRNRSDTKITSALELMKSNLLELAQKYVQQGVGDSKYTSAHIKDGYIEFRSPGGDYLAKADEEINVLEDTMRRFAYAMYLAGRPDLERPEYYKKLYKLIAPEGNRDLELFSKFSAGELTAEQLKKQWAEKTIGKETNTNQRWKLYDRTTGEPVPGQEYNGYTEEEARAKAKGKIRPGASDQDFDLAYELRNMSEEQQWEVYNVDTDETLEIVKGRNRGEVADAVYDKYADQKIGINIRAYTDPATLTPRAKLAKRITQPKKQAQPRLEPSELQAKNERGAPYWEVYEKETGHVIHTLVSDDLPDAVTDAYNWLVSIGAEQPSLFSVRAKMVPNPQARDNRQDSADLQHNLGVRDIDITIDQDSDQYEIVDRRNNRVMLQYRADDAADAGDKFSNWLRNQGMPADTENYGWRPLVVVNNMSAFERNSDRIDAIRARQDATQRSGSWSIYDVTLGREISRMDNVPWQQANDRAEELERSTGHNMSVRGLQESAESDADRARKFMNMAAQKLGYKNWASVPPTAKNSVMQLAVEYMNDKRYTYNMLDKKNKQ